MHYFQESREHRPPLGASIVISKDTVGNCAQITIKVCFPKSKESYTVNLCLTKCSLLINGKSINIFIETDLENNARMTEKCINEWQPS